MNIKTILLAFFAGAALASTVVKGREVVSLDGDWRFFKGDAAGAEQPVYNDSKWQTVRVPHDWSIAGPFAETNLAGGAGAFLPSGPAWYRKHFSLPVNGPGRRVRVEFDGVMQNSDVWINGMHLGHRPNGYAGFRYELPGSLLAYGPGTFNILTVCADTSAQPASRWYAGAGIYRHVRLIITDSVHIQADGVFASALNCSATEATVQIETAVTNESAAAGEITVQTTLVAPDDETVGFVESSQTVEAGAAGAVQQQVIIPHPKEWNLEKPILYRAVTKLRADGKVSDEQTTLFGIRDAHFDADSGFWLNGRNIKLKGVCLHADGGAFGAAVPLAIWEGRLKTLKSLGVNAVRTAHHPPAPEFLDLCDHLGLLVMDEFFDCWTEAKNPYDYHLYFDDWSATDERETIQRDRNHPSVIIYSLGNEIRDTREAEKARTTLAGLIAVAHAADPTRPVTMALFRPNASHDYEDGLADLLDVAGQNYRESELLAAHDQQPARKILGTENTPSREAWLAVRDHAALAGEFLWTGVDYLGESPGWPEIGAGFGLLDRTGAVRPLGRELQSWWSEKPMAAIVRRISPTNAEPILFADWTPETLKPHTENVEVYSNGKEVELFLNGKSLGKKAIHADASPRLWPVPFTPGWLRAVATDERGKGAVTNELRTAGLPVRIRLQSETGSLTPDGDEVTVVRATIVDSRGIAVPPAKDVISFKLTGPGTIAAVDNGDDASHEPFQATSRRAYQGQCVAFIKATGPAGKMTLTATAAGLKSGSVIIWASLAGPR